MPLKNITGFWPVAIALGGNIFIAVIKFVAAAASGSSVMFSEAVHSVADTLNQFFLLVGIRRSVMKPSAQFEYGYGNERFFWALVSACGVLFVGAGITGYRGFLSLASPAHVEVTPLVIFVLLISLAIEGYTFSVAAKELEKAMPEDNWWKRVRRADPSTLAVVLEDGIAVLGVIVALLSLGLAYYTGQGIWDALGSLAIAALLGFAAITLILKNRLYLIGQSMPAMMREEVITLVEADPAIEKVIDFKSSTLGLGSYRIKCEVEFNGPALLRDAYREDGMREEFDDVDGDFEEFKKFLSDYADRIPRLIGKRIDLIETAIRKRFPSIRNIDIEIN